MGLIRRYLLRRPQQHLQSRRYRSALRYGRVDLRHPVVMVASSTLYRRYGRFDLLGR